MNSPLTLWLLSLLSCQLAVADSAHSVYMDTTRCTTVSKDPETGASRSKCGTLGEYTLFLDEDDDRASLTLRAGADEIPLNFYEHVTRHFSQIGPKVEWRLRSREGIEVPYALIARVLWNTDQPKAKGEFLVVSRVLKRKSCVIAKLDASKTKVANQRAREIADAISEQSSCMDTR